MPTARELREPVFHQRSGDHRDRRGGRIGGPLADREMQAVDIFRQLFLERVGDDLRKLCAGLNRQLRVGQQHIRAWHQHADAPTTDPRGRQDPASRSRADSAAPRASAMIQDGSCSWVRGNLNSSQSAMCLTLDSLVRREAALEDADLPGSIPDGRCPLQKTVQGEVRRRQ